MIGRSSHINLSQITQTLPVRLYVGRPSRRRWAESAILAKTCRILPVDAGTWGRLQRKSSFKSVYGKLETSRIKFRWTYRSRPTYTWRVGRSRGKWKAKWPVATKSTDGPSKESGRAVTTLRGATWVNWIKIKVHFKSPLFHLWNLSSIWACRQVINSLIADPVH